MRRVDACVCVSVVEAEREREPLWPSHLFGWCAIRVNRAPFPVFRHHADALAVMSQPPPHWGHPVWHLVHRVTLRYPVSKPSPATQLHGRALLHGIQSLLACRDCQQHWATALRHADARLTGALRSGREALARLLVEMHNAVRVRLGAKPWDAELQVFPQWRGLSAAVAHLPAADVAASATSSYLRTAAATSALSPTGASPSVASAAVAVADTPAILDPLWDALVLLAMHATERPRLAQFHAVLNAVLYFLASEHPRGAAACMVSAAIRAGGVVERLLPSREACREYLQTAWTSCLPAHGAVRTAFAGATVWGLVEQHYHVACPAVRVVQADAADAHLARNSSDRAVECPRRDRHSPLGAVLLVFAAFLLLFGVLVATVCGRSTGLRKECTSSLP